MPARLILLLQIDMIGNGLHIVHQFARLGFYDWCFPSVYILPWPWASRICIKAGRGRVGGLLLDEPCEGPARPQHSPQAFFLGEEKCRHGKSRDFEDS